MKNKLHRARRYVDLDACKRKHQLYLESEYENDRGIAMLSY